MVDARQEMARIGVLLTALLFYSCTGGEKAGPSSPVDWSLALLTAQQTLPGHASEPVQSVAGDPVSIVLQARPPLGEGVLPGLLHFASSDATATLPADVPSAALTTSYTVVLRTAGPQVVYALVERPQGAVLRAELAVSVAAAAPQALSVDVPGPIAPACSFAIVASALDKFGNVSPGYRGMVHLGSSDPNATLPPDTFFTAADRGRHTFTISLPTVGVQTVDVMDVANGLRSGTAKTSIGGWCPLGPGGGDVFALATDPTSPDHLYAGTWGGVFESVDGGGSWVIRNSGLSVPSVTSMAFDRSTPANVVAGTSAGIFRMRSGATTWEGVAPGVYVTGLAVDPSMPSTLFAAVGQMQSSPGILRTDDGVTWAEASAGLPVPRFATALTLDPRSSSTLYAAIDGNSIYRSLDGARTWQATTAPPLLGDLTSLTITAQGILYAGSNGPLVRSADGGATWALSGGSAPANVWTIAADPFAPGVLYVGVGDVARKSIDGGSNWTSLNLLFANVFAFAGPSTVFAGTTGGGVAKSNDSGSSWTPSNAGLVSSSIRAVAVGLDPVRTLYATTSAGIMTSIDQGKSWRLSSSPYSDMLVFAVDPSSPSTVFAGGYTGLERTSDAGATWTSLGGIEQVGLHALILDPSDSKTLYAGGQNGVWKSLDAGLSWTQIGLAGNWMWSLAADPRNPATLYATTMTRLFRSVDRGVTWTTTFGLPGDAMGSAPLAVDPKTSEVYVATRRGVFRSADGLAFTLAASGLPLGFYGLSLAIDPVTPSTLYAGTPAGGIYKTTTGGASWYPIDTGLRQPALPIYSLVIDPAAPATLYAGTGGGGVFRTTTGGE